MLAFFVDVARDDDGDPPRVEVPNGCFYWMKEALRWSRWFAPSKVQASDQFAKQDLKRLRTNLGAYTDGFLSAPELTAISKPVESFYLISAVRKPTGFPFAAPDTKAASGSGSCTEANPGVRRLMYVLRILFSA